jgi:hypothetical protein
MSGIKEAQQNLLDVTLSVSICAITSSSLTASPSTILQRCGVANNSLQRGQCLQSVIPISCRQLRDAQNRTLLGSAQRFPAICFSYKLPISAVRIKKATSATNQANEGAWGLRPECPQNSCAHLMTICQLAGSYQSCSPPTRLLQDVGDCALRHALPHGRH